MRTVHIVLLVLAGALSGAIVMKVTQRPVRVAVHPAAAEAAVPIKQAAPAADPAEQAAASPTLPAQTEPAVVAEGQSPPLTVVQETPEPKPEIKRTRERKLSPLRRVPDHVLLAMSPRVLHTPPQRVELQTPPASLAIPSSPPVLPEPPKETPPARIEPENVTPPSVPIPLAPEPNQATLNAGMLIPVRLLDSLSSERNRAGDSFAATLYRELVANGFVVAERGARVEGRVTAADRDTRTLSLELISVHTLDNQDVPLQTERFDKQNEPDRSQAAAKIGVGAAAGAMVGGIAGGGKGAAIGAGAGGGIGAGAVMLSRRPASLSSETRLTFRLRAPVTITERTQ
jgi:hypothetical protein